jgi:hypothetical protein
LAAGAEQRWSLTDPVFDRALHLWDDAAQLYEGCSLEDVCLQNQAQVGHWLGAVGLAGLGMALNAVSGKGEAT